MRFVCVTAWCDVNRNNWAYFRLNILCDPSQLQILRTNMWSKGDTWSENPCRTEYFFLLPFIVWLIALHAAWAGWKHIPAFLMRTCEHVLRSWDLGCFVSRSCWRCNTGRFVLRAARVSRKIELTGWTKNVRVWTAKPCRVDRVSGMYPVDLHEVSVGEGLTKCMD